MKKKGINVTEKLATAKAVVASGKNIPPEILLSLIESLIMLVELLLPRTSRNSSVAPSQDPNRPRGGKKGSRARGGQRDHPGRTLEKDPNPNEVIDLTVDKTRLPAGLTFSRTEDEVRQVVEMTITKYVKEYRCEVLLGSDGKVYKASFPEGVTHPVQYGHSVKAHCVYGSTYQLIPFGRVQEKLDDECDLCPSTATLLSFNKEMYEKLEPFEEISRAELIESPMINCDETGINISGKKRWLHVVSNEKWTLMVPHNKRGKEGSDALGVLPHYTGVAVHDHWKAYMSYPCTHAFCGAHLVRELQAVIEKDGFEWARDMKALLLDANALLGEGGMVTEETAEKISADYDSVIEKGETETPLVKGEGKRRPAQSTARNLLERFKTYKEDTLRFMIDPMVPFTNNQAERDLRMAKVQQKISGCFRSDEGAQYFARIRSFISTCKKHQVPVLEALEDVLNGKLPSFCKARQGIQQTEPIEQKQEKHLSEACSASP